MSFAGIPRELPRQHVDVVIGGVVRSVRDAFGVLLVTRGPNKIYRRLGLLKEFETITQALPDVHDIEREPSGALHIYGDEGEHLVSSDGGSTWQSLT